MVVERGAWRLRRRLNVGSASALPAGDGHSRPSSFGITTTRLACLACATRESTNTEEV